MNSRKIYYIQEGLYVSKQIRVRFNLEGKDLTGHDGSLCNFTGLVIRGQDVLISWPKNYFEMNEIGQSEEDPSILFKILVKYMDVTEQAYLNVENKIMTEDTYPLRAFQNILSYYNKYGLYREENIIEKKGYAGDIDWKKTISKSNKVISNNKLLYLPFSIKNKRTENVFLSECMAYAINETYSLLSFIMPNRVHVDLGYNKELFLNREYVLAKLQSLKGSIFKDINKRLLHDLISFFELVGNPNEFKYKNYYFHSIWEEMVGEYLNRNLSHISSTEHTYIANCKLFNFRKQNFSVGNRSIDVDHYFETDSQIYILDSKYYQSVRELNYKQVAYEYFLRRKNKPILNALVAPSYKDYVKNHIEYPEDNLVISEHYFNIQNVMRDCASN